MSTSASQLRSKITLRSIEQRKVETQALWYESEAKDLRQSGDCDLWYLASVYEQYAADLRGQP